MPASSASPKANEIATISAAPTAPPTARIPMDPKKTRTKVPRNSARYLLTTIRAFLLLVPLVRPSSGREGFRRDSGYAGGRRTRWISRTGFGPRRHLSWSPTLVGARSCRLPRDHLCGSIPERSHSLTLVGVIRKTRPGVWRCSTNRRAVSVPRYRLASRAEPCCLRPFETRTALDGRPRNGGLPRRP